MKRKVLLRGPLLTSSGYGEHSRQFFRWLESRDDLDVKVQCLNWGNTTWYINPDIEDGLMGRIMQKTAISPGEKFDISIQVQLPDEWDPSIANYNIGVSAFIETNRCTYEWFKRCKNMDRVIAPSNHAQKSLSVFGKPDTELNMINECYNPLINKPDYSFDIKLKTDFNFLVISQLTGKNSETDRKNILNTIKSFCEVFEGDKDVGLVIKTNLGRATTKDRKHTKTMLERIVKETRQSAFPKVYMVHGLLSPREIGSLYRHKKIKGLVSLTRGEGYGLPLLEASVTGMPVIATNWSGHLDFLGDSFVKIDYKLKRIPEEKVDNRIFQSGMMWADPDLDDFKNKIIDFKDNYKTHKKNAKKLSKMNSGKFSQSSFNKIMDGIIK